MNVVVPIQEILLLMVEQIVASPRWRLMVNELAVRFLGVSRASFSGVVDTIVENQLDFRWRYIHEGAVKRHMNAGALEELRLDLARELYVLIKGKGLIEEIPTFERELTLFSLLSDPEIKA